MSSPAESPPPAPIACTLTPSEMQDREAAWRKLLGSGLVERSSLPEGVRLRAAPGAADALMQLIDLERECCAWIRFQVSDQFTVTLGADGEGRAVLDQVFLPA